MGGNTLGRGPQMKKAKTAQIVQDEKIMKALGISFTGLFIISFTSEILQASAKMSFSTWKKSILELDEKTLTSGLLEQLRAALPPVDILNKLKEVDKTIFDEMPEGEQVDFLFNLAYFFCLVCCYIGRNQRTPSSARLHDIQNETTRDPV